MWGGRLEGLRLQLRSAAPRPLRIPCSQAQPSPPHPLHPCALPLSPADARSAWLPVESDDGATVVLRTPETSAKLPPGMYMVVLHTHAGAVSNGHIISVRSRWTVARRG